MTALTQKRLKKLLRYDAKTGAFYRVEILSNRCVIGERAGCRLPSGYRMVSVDGVSHREHRLVWLWHTGHFPKNFTDHRNGIRDDNRFENLREATKGENCQNAAKQQNNTSGYTGVVWEARRKRWLARVKFKGKTHHFGTYRTPEAANSAYLKGKRLLHIFQPIPRAVR
jgi:hypothetical protein